MTGCRRRCPSLYTPSSLRSTRIVILSWRSLCVLHNTLPFCDMVGNFHPYCLVMANEKWTISTAGMQKCFGEPCSYSVTSYTTCRCLASLRLYKRFRADALSLESSSHFNFIMLHPQADVAYTQSDISKQNVSFSRSVSTFEKTKQSGLHWA